MFAELAADGSGTGMTGFVMPLDGVFEMKGKEVWDQATKVLPTSIKKVLSNSNTNLTDIKMLIPHQPSINILKLIILYTTSNLKGSTLIEMKQLKYNTPHQ